jgi:hypothetical protein
MVLASDATHFYTNIEEDRPYSIVSDLAQVYGAFDLVPCLTPRITWCLATTRSSCNGFHPREKGWRAWRFVSPEAGKADEPYPAPKSRTSTDGSMPSASTTSRQASNPSWNATTPASGR